MHEIKNAARSQHIQLECMKDKEHLGKIDISLKEVSIFLEIAKQYKNKKMIENNIDSHCDFNKKGYLVKKASIPLYFFKKIFCDKSLIENQEQFDLICKINTFIESNIKNKSNFISIFLSIKRWFFIDKKEY